VTLEFSVQVFEKSSSIKFYENPSSGSRVVPWGRTDGRTDMKQLLVAFRNFAKTPKKRSSRGTTAVNVITLANGDEMVHSYDSQNL